jgi:hypothetical protein
MSRDSYTCDLFPSYQLYFLTLNYLHLRLAVKCNPRHRGRERPQVVVGGDDLQI